MVKNISKILAISLLAVFAFALILHTIKAYAETDEPAQGESVQEESLVLEASIEAPPPPPSPASPLSPAMCPDNNVTLSSTSLEIGETLTASAPGFTGGIFYSSDNSVASVDGSTITALAEGEVEITGVGFTAANGALNCTLSEKNLYVTAPPPPPVDDSESDTGSGSSSESSGSSSSHSSNSSGSGGGGSSSSRSNAQAGAVLGVQTTESNPTIAALQAQVNALIAQLNTLLAIAKARSINVQTSTNAMGKASLTKDLELGRKGEDVQQLQKFLNSNGFKIAASGPGSPGQETTYFGPATKAALARYQKIKSIFPASGYFGALTRAKVNLEM